MTKYSSLAELFDSVINPEIRLAQTNPELFLPPLELTINPGLETDFITRNFPGLTDELNSYLSILRNPEYRRETTFKSKYNPRKTYIYLQYSFNDLLKGFYSCEGFVVDGLLLPVRFQRTPTSIEIEVNPISPDRDYYTMAGIDSTHYFSSDEVEDILVESLQREYTRYDIWRELKQDPVQFWNKYHLDKLIPMVDKRLLSPKEYQIYHSNLIELVNWSGNITGIFEIMLSSGVKYKYYVISSPDLVTDFNPNGYFLQEDIYKANGQLVRSNNSYFPIGLHNQNKIVGYMMVKIMQDWNYGDLVTSISFPDGNRVLQNWLEFSNSP